MRTQFFIFGGGLLTGALAAALIYSSVGSTAPDAASTMIDRPGDIEYVEVSIDTFYKDIARYRQQHASVVEPRMRPHTRNEASRMFLYSVTMLEDFISLVKEFGDEADVEPDNLAIRFYYGVYPKGQRIKGQDYSSLHTVFMVPNVWSQEEKQFRDINISQLARDIKADRSAFRKNKDKEEFIQRYYLENMYKADKAAKMFMLDASAVRYTGRDSIYRKAAFFPSLSLMPPIVINQGQLCPPNCPNLSLLRDADRLYPDPQPSW